MGGHGGLNILPQKKWNVYNYDNRAIVEKDKKEAAAKKKAQYQKDRQSKLSGKLQVLQQQNQEHKQKAEQIIDEPLINNLNQQFKQLNEKRNINFFEREQKMIQNQQVFQAKRLKEEQFLKDKNMDYSSKFLGTYADGNKKTPWYARQKGYVEYKKKPAQLEQLLSVKKSDSHTISQVIKIEKKQHDKKRDRSNSRQRSRQKNIKKQYKSQMDILREKRLKRQEKQRQKAARLKMQKTNI